MVDSRGTAIEVMDEKLNAHVVAMANCRLYRGVPYAVEALTRLPKCVWIGFDDSSSDDD